MKKRIISILLALCLSLSLLGITAAADTYPDGTVIIPFTDGVPTAASGDGWSYDADSSTLTLDVGRSFAAEGECRVKVICKGTLVDGVFYEEVRIFGTASGGLYYGGMVKGIGGTIENAEFPLTFALGSGSWGEGAAVPTLYSYKNGCPLPDASALDGGELRFDGWYDNAAFDGEPLTAVPAGRTNALTLYARFVGGIATWPEAGGLAQPDRDYAIDASGNYTIYTAKGLALLASTVNAGDDLKGKTVTLANDIDLADGGVYEYGASTVTARNSWVPISGFGGVFDGGGHSISNLYVAVSDKDAGLFGSSYGTIRDLEIASGRISVEKLAKRTFRVGGIAASSTGQIENCINRAEIYAKDDDTIHATTDDLYLGGIVGIISTDGEDKDEKVSAVTGCVNYGSVASLGLSASCSISAGGIAGYQFCGFFRDYSTLITECANYGTVSVPNGTYHAWAGGITGTLKSNAKSTPAALQNCENHGKVASGYCAGGIAGLVDATGDAAVHNSYNTGAVSGATDAGGIAGIFNYSGALVENCYSSGSVSGGTNVGGCAGLASYGTLRNCYSSGSAAIFGKKINGATITDCALFTSNGGVHTLEREILGTTDLLTALKAWVRAKNDPAYLDWMADKNDENYPIFARSYTVTVRRGIGSGTYLAGDVVSIHADAPAGNEYFTGWTGTGGVTFADSTSADTTFVMPARNVTVTATFKTRDSGNGTKQPTTPRDTTGVSSLLITDAHIRYLRGHADGTFGADSDMTRAEAAQMFFNLLRNKDAAVTARFTDVAGTAWYAQAVGTLASLGVIEGVGGGRFAPERSITRAEFAALAMRFAKQPAAGKNVFGDVSEDAWYYAPVVGAVAYGWIGGYPDGTFGPERTITRAEAAAIVDRMLERSGDARYIRDHADELVSFSDLSNAHWAYRDIMEAANAHEYTKANNTEHWK